MNIRDIKKWFQKQPPCLQLAGKYIIEKRQLSSDDEREIFNLCLNEKPYNISVPIEKLKGKESNNVQVELISIGSIEGIDNLSTKSPLKFDSKLSVIYGDNATGKSGYIRILKNICGVKMKPILLSNVYKENSIEKKCTIIYKKNNTIKEEVWTPNKGMVIDLDCIDIFDSKMGENYICNENEVTYEPPVLSFFSDLVKVCDKISSQIDDKINTYPSKKPMCPEEYKRTEWWQWYNGLSEDTKKESLNKYCSWTNSDEQHLKKIKDCQSNSEQKSKNIKKKNEHIKKLIKGTEDLLNSFSDEQYKIIQRLKKELSESKEIAETAAKEAFSNASLGGVGSSVWKKLWKYAKEYSEKEAYKGQHFPVVSDGTLCVLCHQELDDKAKKRFSSFEKFIRSMVQKDVDSKTSSLDEFIKLLPIVPNEEGLQCQIDAGDLNIDNTELQNLYVELKNRKDFFTNLANQSNLPLLPPIDEWKSKVEKIVIENDNTIKQSNVEMSEEDKEALLVKKKNLECKKWCFEQKKAITEEIDRLKRVKSLKKAQGLVSTVNISKKKSELSQELITKNFIKRFNSELEALEANKIKVEIIKLRVEKGKALHKIQLKGVTQEPTNIKKILSEGENRIVALSAFLADFTGGGPYSPVIFDDPMSSLDQKFEEAVVKRLIKLSQDRQVIVFTHRLSILGLFEEFSKKYQITPSIICIKKEHWSDGEPGKCPFLVNNPKNELKGLIDDLPKVKKVYEKKGLDFYTKEAGELCKRFRMIIESVTECILLNNIVRRHRRQVHISRIKDLSKIEKNDCDLIDNLMTKYSKFMHPGTDETSNNLPLPDELLEDFNKMKNWIEEYKNRKLKI